MTLTPEQRDELEALGAATVRVKLVQAGAGRWTTLVGFKTGEDGKSLTRGDVEDWLIDKSQEERLVQATTLRWARIAGWSGIIGATLALISAVTVILLLIWLMSVPDDNPTLGSAAFGAASGAGPAELPRRVAGCNCGSPLGAAPDSRELGEEARDRIFSSVTVNRVGRSAAVLLNPLRTRSAHKVTFRSVTLRGCEHSRSPVTSPQMFRLQYA